MTGGTTNSWASGLRGWLTSQPIFPMTYTCISLLCGNENKPFTPYLATKSNIPDIVCDMILHNIIQFFLLIFFTLVSCINFLWVFLEILRFFRNKTKYSADHFWNIFMTWLSYNFQRGGHKDFSDWHMKLMWLQLNFRNYTVVVCRYLWNM